MTYNETQWVNKIRSRSDLSSYLYHMTRGKDGRDDVENLIKILKDGILYGSSRESGYVVGKDTAVCFQDVPVTGLAQNVLDDKKRYSSSGIGFQKEDIYFFGGRPVIYEKTDNAKELLPTNEWWRIVNFNLSDPDNYIDWTHEREWRIKGDFNFIHVGATYHIILGNWENYQRFIKLAQENDINLENISGIILLEPIIT